MVADHSIYGSSTLALGGFSCLKWNDVHTECQR